VAARVRQARGAAQPEGEHGGEDERQQIRDRPPAGEAADEPDQPEHDECAERASDE